MSDAGPRLHPSWLDALQPEFDQPYMRELRSFLVEEKRQHTVYPPGGEIFNAFNLTPLDRVRLVVLGQDPYFNPHQAHGLCFSVRRGITPPPSLKNIYRELHEDVGFTPPGHGELTAWAERGVLLLNAVLTVRAGEPMSHGGRGWERFTDRAIAELAARREGLVFLLWGRPAQQKAEHVDRERHLVLTAAHPSPRSADRGFFGCRHFSRANTWFSARGEPPFDWSLPA